MTMISGPCTALKVKKIRVEKGYLEAELYTNAGEFRIGVLARNAKGLHVGSTQFGRTYRKRDVAERAYNGFVERAKAGGYTWSSNGYQEIRLRLVD